MLAEGLEHANWLEINNFSVSYNPSDTDMPHTLILTKLTNNLDSVYFISNDIPGC